VTARALLILIVMSLGVAHAQYVRSQPILAGEETLTKQDIGEIARLASPEQHIWMIDATRCKPGGCIAATVYFLPELETATLRRGHGMSFLKGTAKDSNWQVFPRPWAWAQVAFPGNPFGKELVKPSKDSWPIIVHGQISDQQLIDIVRLIRGLPPYAPSLHGMRDVKVSGIEAGSNGVFTVIGSPDYWTLQKVELSAEAGVWKIRNASVEYMIP
jgi:hypothetical protein